MSMILFTVIAIVLYIAADRIIDFAEHRYGERFRYRTVYFFVLLLTMALISFSLLSMFEG